MEQVKKIIIVGSKGMAGHVIYYFLKENTNYNVVDIARGTDYFNPKYNLDVSNFSALEDILITEKPDFVINCIGILNQDAEDNPDKAILFNSYFPHFLARVGSEIGFKVIHISTDCVFNGKLGGYLEDSFKDGIGVYAQTKALGELNYGANVTIRTSIVGPELKKNGIGLFHWFMQQQDSIKGYSKAYWTGVTTIELAKAICAVIDQDLIGLHHLVNNNKISKYELVTLFNKIFRQGKIAIEEWGGYSIDKSLIKTNNDFNYHVPSYEQMTKEMYEWISSHKDLYNYNF